jgi:predicted nucleotidyltransferase
MDNELERLLRGAVELQRATDLDVVLIGGVARGAWASPRATRDVDVIVGTAELEPVIAAAPHAGLTSVPDEVAWLASADMTRLRLPDHLTGPVRLDVIAAVHPYYERVIARARSLTVLGLEVQVACPEDVILLKVLADRPQDRADVRAIIEAQADLDWDLLRTEAAALELELPEPGY